MKIFKILLAGLLLGAVVVSMVGCGSSKAAATKSQTHTVTRGNISVDITAAGNLALSTIQDLTFDLFYAKGTVGSVNVTAGDTVTKGEILASLDAPEWNDQIQLLEDALTTAQRNVTTKQRSLATAERQVTTLTRQVTAKEEAVTKAERQVTAKELAVQQAQIDVQTANNTLNKIAPIKNIQDRIDNLKSVITIATSLASGEFAGAVTSITPLYWYNLKTQAQAELAQAQQDMQNILNGNATLTSVDVAIQVAQSQLQIKTKQMALEDAQTAVEDARTAIDDANTAVTNARQDLTFAQQDAANAQSDLNTSNQKAADAQDSLSKAHASSPEIKAPFDGFVTKVNVAGGAQVLSGAVIVQVADPNKFEADILVSEMDISQVKVGGEATVALGAISGVTLPAKVTQIAPTATIQSGVVNYSVKVEVDSTGTIIRSQSANVTSSTGSTTSELPAMLQAAVDAGRITKQQAEDFVKNGLPSGPISGQGFAASGNFTLPQGFSFSGSPGSQRRSQTSSVVPENIQLRQGLTVTVSIIVASRTNVVLVPNAAVTKQGGQSYVNVVSASGALEKRVVQTGLSDWQNTEITSGLTEGEKVSVPQGTTTTTTSSSQNRGGGIPFIGPGR